MSGRSGVALISVVLVLIAAALLPSPAWADDADVAVEPEAPAVTFEFSMDWTSGYYFRGLLQEDGGSIWQPGGWPWASDRDRPPLED